MKLPNAVVATIPEGKITGYLLSPTHRLGRSKALVLSTFGFDGSRPEELAQALLRHAMEHDVTGVETTQFGTKWIIDGRLECPNGRWLNLRAVWFTDEEAGVPRFVTAYPLKGPRP